MFLEHHVDIPPGKVTPDEVRMAINSWIVHTFHRESRLAASDMDPAHFPHGSKDALEANPDDPLDTLHCLPSLSPPEYLSGNLCATKNCTYLAYIHTRCAACCRVKYRVEVKRSTGGDGGLGLFAATRLEGRTSRNAVIEPWDLHRVPETQFIFNFCTDFHYLQDDHCTHPPHSNITLLRIDDASDINTHIIRYQYLDESRIQVYIKCDATEIALRTGNNTPGLGRYIVVNPRRSNTKFVNKGARTWGFKVRDWLVIQRGEEIFPDF